MFTFEGETYTLASMLEANKDSESFCEWLMEAEVGDIEQGCERIA